MNLVTIKHLNINPVISAAKVFLLSQRFSKPNYIQILLTEMYMQILMKMGI